MPAADAGPGLWPCAGAHPGTTACSDHPLSASSPWSALPKGHYTQKHYVLEFECDETLVFNAAKNVESLILPKDSNVGFKNGHDNVVVEPHVREHSPHCRFKLCCLVQELPAKKTDEFTWIRIKGNVYLNFITTHRKSIQSVYQCQWEPANKQNLFNKGVSLVSATLAHKSSTCWRVLCLQAHAMHTKGHDVYCKHASMFLKYRAKKFGSHSQGVVHVTSTWFQTPNSSSAR